MQDERSRQLGDPTKFGRLQEEWEADREMFRPHLLRQIEAAFDGVELGGGTSLHQARAIDDYWHLADFTLERALDTEHRWQDIPDEKIHRRSDTLSFMDSEGFRFHIPRFMTYALLNESSHSCALNSAIYATATPECYARHMSALSEDQRAAIEAFADFFSEGR